MTVKGVLFDFSGTLFRLEVPAGALPDPAARDRFLAVRAVVTAAEPPSLLPPEFAEDWVRRDLSPERHRRANLAALRGAGITEPGLAERFYELQLRADSWQPYPDVRAALELLRGRGIPVAVVSNIAWDIRPAFDRIGVTGLIGAFVLSYEEGAVKPDPELFRIAAGRIGVDPADALMVGDNPVADGGAAALGAAVAIVPAVPTAERPDALLRALAEHGLG